MNHRCGAKEAGHRKTMPLLPNVTLNVLRLVEQSYKDKRKFTDADILKLHTVFGSTLERALELLDKRHVTVFQAGDGRSAVQVIGSTGQPYTLFQKINFCCCQAYTYNVIRTGTCVTCKHVLATWLAEIMNKVQKIQVTPEQLFQILCAAAKLQMDKVV